MNGTLTNLPATVSTLEFYRTNYALDLARGADVAVTGGSFSVSVPADTYFTLATPAPASREPSARSTRGSTQSP
jgi:hypothetical protein